MKDVSLSIDQSKIHPKSMDFDYLRKKAISYTQEISGDAWTDYNVHDPGVTILEQFCYALTDISYRTHLPIEKLLFHSGDIKEVMDSNALYPPEDVFPCAPLTAEDYRVWVVDQFYKHVSNAWIKPISHHKEGLKGLYSIKVILKRKVGLSDSNEVVDKIKEKFAAYRNLGEDLESVDILTPVRLTFEAKLDLIQDASGEDVIADILYKIENYINPSIEFCSLEDLQNQGCGLETIYDTASSQHGFIKEGQLQPRKYDFYVSKIADYIVGLKEVRGLRDFKVFQNGIPVFGDILSINEEEYLTLNINQLEENTFDSFDIKLYKGGVLNRYLDASVIYSLGLKEAHEKQVYQTKKDMILQEPIKVSTEQLSSYPSIQSTFPSIYGIGNFTPHERDGKKRLAQSRQLQGYLLFFDQLMANHLAQLQHIRQLFSVSNLNPQSYFTQLLAEDTPGVQVLLDDIDQLELDNLVNESNDSTRKNRVLSHLLARFGERFTTEFHLQFDQFLEGVPKEQSSRKLLSLKAIFLRDIVNLNRLRGLGLNYRKDYQSQAPISLKKKICLLLNIKNSDNKKLAEASLPKILKKKKIDVSSLELIKSNNDIYYDDFAPKKDGAVRFIVNSKSVVEYLFRYGLNVSNYKIIEEELSSILLFSPPQKKQQVKIGSFSTKKVAVDSLDRLVSFLKNLNTNCEGFHIVEHILFRPINEDVFFFSLISENRKVLYRSTKEGGAILQKDKARDSVLLGCYRINYEILSNKDKKHVVFIKNGVGEHFVKSKEFFDSEQLAEKFIDESVQIFNNSKNRDDIGSHFEIEDQKKCHFSILNDSGKKIMVSSDASLLAIQENRINELSLLALTVDNYKLTVIDQTTVIVQVINFNGDVLAVNHPEISSIEEADLYVNQCILFFENKKHSEMLMESVVFSRSDGRESSNYNSKISIVYPNWTAKFQSEEFLQIFSKTIFNCAPVHLGIDMVGLSFNKMKKFEGLYFDYLNHLTKSSDKSREELMYMGDEMIGILSASSIRNESRLKKL